MPPRMTFIGALALMVAAVPLAAAPAPHVDADWFSHVQLSPEGGHVIGNPAARLKLVEYMSYTCPHCANFDTEAMASLHRTYIAPGTVSLEVRHFLRDPIDLTIAEMTNCVPPERFTPLHEAFLSSQPQWMATAQRATPDQVKRWSTGTLTVRMRAIAGDLGFYAIMADHGVNHAGVDRCLANQATARRITAQTQAAQKLGIEGTPGFTLNGALLTGTYNWQALQPQLQAQL